MGSSLDLENMVRESATLTRGGDGGDKWRGGCFRLGRIARRECAVGKRRGPREAGAAGLVGLARRAGPFSNLLPKI
jgi:hypothetical protein